MENKKDLKKYVKKKEKKTITFRMLAEDIKKKSFIKKINIFIMNGFELYPGENSNNDQWDVLH